MLGDNWHEILTLLILMMSIIWIIKSQLYIIKNSTSQEIENKILISSLNIRWWHYQTDNNQLTFKVLYIVDNLSAELISTSIINEQSNFIVDGITEDHLIEQQSPETKIFKPYERHMVLCTNPITISLNNKESKEIKLKASLALEYTYYCGKHDKKYKAYSQNNYWTLKLVFDNNSCVTNILPVNNCKI